MAEKSTVFPFVTSVPANQTYCEVNSHFRYQFLPVMYVIVFVMGFLGNCWVLVAMCLNRRKWTSMTVFLFNLGLADLLYVITLPFLVAYYAGHGRWSFGKVFCRITRLVFHLNLYGSIGFLTCISVQRYLGIVYPMKMMGRWKPRHSVLISVLVWGLVLTQTSVDLYFTKTNADGTNCHDTTVNGELLEYIRYNLALSAIGFFIPFLIILGCYSHVFIVLTRSKNVDPDLRDRCLKLVVIVTVLFSLCFTPYHVLRNANLISRYLQVQGQCNQTFRNIYLTYQVSRALASLNSGINPLVYFLAGTRIEKLGRKVRRSLSAMVTFQHSLRKRKFFADL
ncbi:P2Y purinoceptor 1-like [Heptranchias perlo]|uniref:P2Y purinoceptor 1-like n=1 Tax=Heptranchias perlo TaxID=212740 RepID=UPI00355A11BA